MKLDPNVRVLMRPGVLRRGAAAFASIFCDQTQFIRIALFPRWLVSDRIACPGQRQQITVLCWWWCCSASISLRSPEFGKGRHLLPRALQHRSFNAETIFGI